ncbi:hypothetical protein [Salinicoccus roseus]|uniref:PglD N-terminal domain-containing protein n=1 Tax=Salinicoccus roseus TaxID=45670 RepID=A0A0C2DN65_9STAP|nr:hypothetical protein [Salinicoccus roseus]KIH71418.1 hypothetical protein SN16_01660 [Salinicoccus roseus]MDB0579477.1 hypothetical protein [Salinicoccus roseus]
MVDLYIVGAGGLGRGLADALIYDNGESIEESFGDIYFIDDYQVNKTINGILVKKSIVDFINTKTECLVLNAIGEPKLRRKVQNQLSDNTLFKFPNFIDKDVKIYNNIILGEGNIVTRGVVFSTNIEIGDFNLIHFNCTIGHDVKIGNYNCIYPLTSISGYTELGNENMLGTNSSTLPSVILGNDIIVGANSLVNKNFLNEKKIYGSPAREMRKIGDNKNENK